MPNNIDITTMINKDTLATEISEKFVTWENARAKAEKLWTETLEYLYATDTREIMSISRDYDNTTHIPKLTQIRDLLITYYYEAIFGLPDYIEWDSYTKDTLSTEVRNSLKAFVRQKLDEMDFEKVLRKAIEDYVDFGNAYVIPIWTKQYRKSMTGEKMLEFEGVKAVRIDPFNMYFDPSVPDFYKTPKIVRSIKTLGELKREIEELGDNEGAKEAFNQALKTRSEIYNVQSNFGAQETWINDELNIAGFGNLSSYMCSDSVEILTFYGDIYDRESNKIYTDAEIAIMDRSVVLYNREKTSDIIHTGWRDRKNSCIAMSPLDNLKGMQYMVDFLDNKRADIFNFISNPVIVAQGDIDMPTSINPGTVLNVDVDARVDFLRPDATALSADNFRNDYMLMMEEMAGAPKQAFGIRTPGEKTAFEVAELKSASMRIFERQSRKFEEEFVEPLINTILRMYFDQLRGQDIVIKFVDKDGTVSFDKIPIDAIKGEGRLYAVGSRTYTERSRALQTLMQLSTTPLYNDELIKNYFSPERIVDIITYTSGLDRFSNITKTNARLTETMKVARAQQYAQQKLQSEAEGDAENVQQNTQQQV